MPPRPFAVHILQASYDGITFPVSQAKTSSGHDFVAHLAYRVPGADIEPTGRKPDSGVLVIPFHNDVPGNWGEPLYPTRYRRLLNHIKRQPMGRFIHPTRGPMTAILHAVEEDVSPAEMDGITLEVSWVEHNATAAVPSRDPAIDPRYRSPSAMYEAAARTDAAMIAQGYAGNVLDQLTTIIGNAQDFAGTVGTALAAFTLAAEYVQELIDSETWWEPRQWPILGNLFDLLAYVQSTKEVFTGSKAGAAEVQVDKDFGLTDVARGYYDDPDLLAAILTANPIEDPSALEPGSSIVIPSTEQALLMQARSDANEAVQGVS